MLPNFLRGLFGQKVQVVRAEIAPDFEIPSKDTLPQVNIKVSGIVATIEREHGHLRWHQNEKGDRLGPRHEEDHFVVSLRSDGTNPEYPEGAIDKKIYLVNNAEDSKYLSWSMEGDFLVIGKSSRFTSITIGERPYKNPKEKGGGMFFGRVPEIDYPAHSILSVTGYAVGPEWGKMEIRGQELGVRKSVVESPAYQRAVNSPHYILDVC